MSAAAARRPAPSRVADVAPARRPSLRLVAPRPHRAGRTPFVLLLAGLLSAGLLGLLALNTLLAQDAFALHALEVQGRELTAREQLLQGQVEDLEAPAALAERAAALGLVPSGPPAFLRLPDGVVLGSAEAAAPPPAPAPVAPAAADLPATDGPAPDVPATDVPATDLPATGAAAGTP